MTYAANGGPTRTVPTPSGQKHEGHFQSIKNHRTMHWEARAEQLLIQHSEAFELVAAYQCQPHRLDLNVASPTNENIPNDVPTTRGWKHEHFVYYPDMLQTLADGRKLVIEAKQNYQDAVGDLDYLRKILAVESFYKSAGYQFSVLTAEEDLSQPILSQNVRNVVLDRHTKLSTHELLAISLHLDSRAGSSTYGALVDELCLLNSLSSLANRAKLHAAIVQRVIGVNMRQRIGSTSPIWTVPISTKVQQSSSPSSVEVIE
ncbi:hypothetical protein PSC71_02355 [Devosia sp. J2-20]|uniref:hypothetical protein n=1 Tax=Devosia sp. J2-20 TaxID=3026161 RepID=UPI00249BC975|nr:hypothetical protein [Devosia sp. J2-20]WDQ99669.1 hypothetical protein PSC71_02355 [Devosia sp. J2-20]